MLINASSRTQNFFMRKPNLTISPRVTQKLHELRRGLESPRFARALAIMLGSTSIVLVTHIALGTLGANQSVITATKIQHQTEQAAEAIILDRASSPEPAHISQATHAPPDVIQYQGLPQVPLTSKSIPAAATEFQKLLAAKTEQSTPTDLDETIQQLEQGFLDEKIASNDLIALYSLATDPKLRARMDHLVIAFLNPADPAYTQAMQNVESNLANPDPEIRSGAILLYLDDSNNATFQTISQLYQQESSAKIRISLLNRISWTQDPQAIAFLSTQAQNSNNPPDLQAAAQNALTQLESDQ